MSPNDFIRTITSITNINQEDINIYGPGGDYLEDLLSILCNTTTLISLEINFSKRPIIIVTLPTQEEIDTIDSRIEDLVRRLRDE